MMLGLGTAVELKCPEGYFPNVVAYVTQGAAGSSEVDGYVGTCFYGDVYRWEEGEPYDSQRHQAWLAARPDVPALNWEQFKSSHAPHATTTSPVAFALAAAAAALLVLVPGGGK